MINTLVEQILNKKQIKQFLKLWQTYQNLCEHENLLIFKRLKLFELKIIAKLDKIINEKIKSINQICKAT